MDIYELMKNRRSTREFLKKDVSEKKLLSILKAGQYAPSGADQKPYVYIVIDDRVLKEKIKTILKYAKTLALVIILFLVFLKELL